MKSPFNQKCFYLVLALFIITCGLLWFTHRQYSSSKKLVEEVEYYDSLNQYNKLYYEKTFDILKKENKQLYDSLKQYKNKIDFIVQFNHEKENHTGQVHTKPNVKDSIVHDSIPLNIPNVSKTYEYTSEPNDTFQYKLNVNSFTEPLWYSLDVKVKNKFTIVNKENGNGGNHITIKPDNGGTISDVTVFKKKKRSFWDRVSVGPSVTAGYDVVNKQFGIMVGGSVTIDLK